MKQKIMSGMRPTGKLHLGHYLGVIDNWVKLQDEYDCYFSVADWHALTTKYDKTDSMKEALRFRNENSDLISKGTFTSIKTDKERVFAFSRSYQDDTIIVLGNLDFKHPQKRITAKVSGLNKKKDLKIIEGLTNYKIKNNRLLTDLEAGEIKVLRISNFAL